MFLNTNYTADKSAYQSDIVLCVGWLINIDNNDVPKVIEDIIDTSTANRL